MINLYIRYFKRKHQDRVTLIKLLTEYDKGITLKSAKEMLDNMLDGMPIEYHLPDESAEEFITKIEELNLEFEVVKS